MTVVVLLAKQTTSAWPSKSRRTIWPLLAVFLFASVKHGFVRHDRFHVAGFFLAVMIGLCAFPKERRNHLAGYTAGLALALVCFMQASNVSFYTLVNARLSAVGAMAEGRALASPERRVAIIGASRDAMQASYGLSHETLDLLRRDTFHPYPWEAGIAWAYPELRWDPLPVFQAYSAYTPDLDEVNAQRLQGSEAPARILREQGTIDGRNADWDSPRTMLALLCNYLELHVQDRWQILANSNDRCAEERHIATIDARINEPVAIPQVEDQIVLAKITNFKRSPLYELRAGLWKAPLVHATLDSAKTYRLLPATAGDGLIVRSPQGLGYTAEFATGSASTIALDSSDSWATRTNFTIEFVGVTLLPPSPLHEGGAATYRETQTRD